jgi:hypothetical protein
MFFYDYIDDNFTSLIKMSNDNMDDETHKWTHYFWTNDISAIPKTVNWFRSNGYIIRELKELDSKYYDQTVQDIVNDMLEDRFAAAADILRLVIL